MSTQQLISSKILDNHEHTTFRRWPEVVAETLEQLGVESKPLFTKAGVDKSFWINPSARIPVKKMQNVWKEAVAQTGESAFGIYVAENLSPYDFQSLGMLLLSSASIAEMLESLGQYRSFISSGIGDGSVSIKDDTTIIKLDFPPHQRALVAEESLDAFLAFLIKLCRMLSSNSFSPIDMSLTRKKPENDKLYESYFNCPIHFNEKSIRIAFKTDDITASNKNYNPELIAILDKELKGYLGKYSELSLKEQIKLIFKSRLEPKPPSEIEVANILNMSKRNLQLKLKSSGTTYREIRQSFLMEESIRLIKEERRSVTYTALELGFSDTSNFVRSFKKWFGTSPSNYS